MNMQRIVESDQVQTLEHIMQVVCGLYIRPQMWHDVIDHRSGIFEGAMWLHTPLVISTNKTRIFYVLVKMLFVQVRPTVLI